MHAEDFDPLFAMSEEDCVEGFIKREMQRAGITEEQNLIPEDMLRRKNILNAVLAVLLFVYISLFFRFQRMKLLRHLHIELFILPYCDKVDLAAAGFADIDGIPSASKLQVHDIL